MFSIFVNIDYLLQAFFVKDYKNRNLIFLCYVFFTVEKFLFKN